MLFDFKRYQSMASFDAECEKALERILSINLRNKMHTSTNNSNRKLLAGINNPYIRFSPNNTFLPTFRTYIWRDFFHTYTGSQQSKQNNDNDRPNSV